MTKWGDEQDSLQRLADYRRKAELIERLIRIRHEEIGDEQTEVRIVLA